ncbi:MAG: bifunctional diaminohydroxyphosphoribosylaminopyrimidine deaminase/5-amino-6-(5-phosphoribosylamino)uracil reductase RibD [Prevotella sp.]|nr:bifunctional diaminohydroxyphosphoribosylaminopyrimidine deaminase/5-amino-6-(5-phosphoribosylamino)uracil reductase RibD [Prevotella sp.]
MVQGPQESLQRLTPEQLKTDEQYMRRCLQLARNGMQNAKPNPMVGAVIVSRDGRIIGEGYHVRCGQGHAEVNAFASVRPADEPLLRESTIYVSLEPCSHWGKTPPCADLIVSKRVRRMVCGCIDPFAEVQGRGIERIREAGIEVTVGVLERECLELNRKFITVNTEKRPYIILKWAETKDGKIGFSPQYKGLPKPLQRRGCWVTTAGDGIAFGNPTPPPLEGLGEAPVYQGTILPISTPFTKMLVHKLRAENDAILVGHETVNIDHPQLNIREWSGNDPERIVLAHSTEGMPEWFKCFSDIDTMLSYLRVRRRQSLIVEGGAITLQGFLDRGLWDEIRVETAPFTVEDGTPAPQLPVNVRLVEQHDYDGNIICRYMRDKNRTIPEGR